MATDGNLSRNKAQMSIKSKDRDQLETVCRCLNLTAAMSWSRSGFGGGMCLRIQWHGRDLYDWLLSIGSDAGEEPHARRSRRAGGAFRRLLPRLCGWGRLHRRVHRPLSRREERAIRLRTALRVARIGEPTVPRVDTADPSTSPWCYGRHQHQQITRQAIDLGAAVRQARIDPRAPLDLLLADRRLSCPEARDRRAVSLHTRAEQLHT